ncbi:hypothetical protein [Flavobacterium sp. FlaQc-48]|uniref:hypothetical protein n=1 Tax=Flavobacterium sp. FlaQc-48 TaxID=3374181 RepID=UPI0037581709
MKKIFAITILFISLTASAQAYHPRFTDLFLNDPDESLFSPELNYFRKELKGTSDMLFVGDLQTSIGPSASFYSFKVIPRVFEYNFLNSGVFLKYNVATQDKFASFFVTFEEFINEDEASGNGRIELENKGLSLVFDPKDIKVFDAVNNVNKKSSRAEFVIRKIEYKIDKTNLEIQLIGSFATAINIKGKKLKKEALSTLTLNADKNKFNISYIDPVKKKKKFIIDQNVKL